MDFERLLCAVANASKLVSENHGEARAVDRYGGHPSALIAAGFVASHSAEPTWGTAEKTLRLGF